ncbi:hypothetical protein [Infirmifilum sp. NZ]|uniref:hypothetical protein n=1 Tax=Infirmifilum sp. NZ TaxID=2926850 RepID=UPI0027A9EA88|nr:hypothetical protein [Infirmifilum sp. NZ]UNQ73973.1 hypothetical protein MOV14_02885 [Infirmifilum sp. NZ]
MWTPNRQVEAMETARRTTIATLLLALAIVAFATATVTLVNITEWTVMAQGSPVVKVAGSDVGNKPGSYVNVTSSTASDGTNRTRISVVGFKGDPTTYTSVLKICNKNYTKSVSVTLKYNGTISGDWTYIEYIDLLYPGSSPSQTLHITSTTPRGTSIPLGTIDPGHCSDDIGVKVLVTPDAPTNQELITFEVDVVSTG